MKNILIADSGSTKADWCFLHEGRKDMISTTGISPYFLDSTQIQAVMTSELLPELGESTPVNEVYYYGTGCADPDNVMIMEKILGSLFPSASLFVTHDLMGAARATCGHSEGVACILGTGSGTCYYDGNRIAKSQPGLGYILGDEGSGAYLGRKVLQYYLYDTFDEELRSRFEKSFDDRRDDILEKVYKQPRANRYLASFSGFLAENRGHFMIENILEDGLNDFFFSHIFKYSESWHLPLHFVGTIAWVYQDVLRETCSLNELELGKIIRRPMEGLIEYHAEDIA